MSRPPAKRDIAEVTEFAEAYKRDREVFRPYHEAMGLEYNYGLKLKHHSTIDTTKGARKQQLTVSSLDLYDIIRYSAAQISGSSIYLDVRPVAPGDDAADSADLEDAAAQMKSALDDQLHSPEIGYLRVRRRVVKHAIAARAGAAKLDIVTGGPHGAEVIPSVVDPQDLSWDRRYLHFNEFGCPYLDERIKDVPLEWVRNNPDFLHGDLVQPDDGKAAYPPVAKPTADDYADKRETCTLVVRWIKDDDEVIEAELEESQSLPPEQWYMACPTCGYSEADLRDHPGYDGGTLPEAMPCPQCGVTPEGLPVSYMHRIEVEKHLGTLPAYENKHRRVVFAPFSPDAGFLQDGPWPEKLTNFPVLMYVPDPYTIEHFGSSDTFLNQDLQALKNAALRMNHEQMERNRDLLIVKEDALWDAAHEPYQFDGTGDFVAFTEDYDSLRGIQHFQGSGLSPAAGAWMGMLNSELNQHRGIGQVALSPEQLKGVQVGTIARSVETGDVPLDEKVRILREDEEQFFTRWAEMIASTWDRGRWIEVTGNDGEVAHRYFKGSDAPLLRIRVHAAPDLNAVDTEQLKALQGLQGIKSPTLLRFAGQTAKLPSHIVEALIKEVTAPPPGAMPPGAGGMPNAGPSMPPENPAMSMAGGQ